MWRFPLRRLHPAVSLRGIHPPGIQPSGVVRPHPSPSKTGSALEDWDMSPLGESPCSSRISQSSGSAPTICSNLGGRSSVLIFGQDQRVADWVRSRLPDFIGWNGYYVAIGYEREGDLTGGVVFTQFSGCNIVIACALEAPLTRRFLRGIFFYPFHQLKCRRVTALIDSKNLKSRSLVEHAGFVQ